MTSNLKPLVYRSRAPWPGAPEWCASCFGQARRYFFTWREAYDYAYSYARSDDLVQGGGIGID